MVLRSALLAALLCASAAEARETALRDYVLGRYAASADDLGRAAGYFDGALAGRADPLLVRRAFDLAIAGGDEALALRLADRLPPTDSYDAALTLLRITNAFQKKDWAAADAARTKLGDAGFAAFATPVIEAWTLYGRGNLAGALAKLDSAQQTGFARAYVDEHRAHMLAASKRWPEAAALYQTLLAGQGAQVIRIRLSAAAALQASGHADEAARILAAGNDPASDAAAQRLAQGKTLRTGVDDAAAGVAALFVRMAADLSRENPVPTALLLARLATFLQPNSGDAALVTADILARGGQSDAALAALAPVRDDDPIAASIRARRAAILQGAGRAPESLAILERSAAATNRMADWARLGEAYQSAERYADASKAFDKALALSQPKAPEQWYLYFSRGASRERAGDWKGAEADLRQAIALAPEQAVALNYLGYAMLDRGARGDEAQALIERASKLRPDDGYITDSLGWAYFRNQRYAEAVETLERAAATVPDDTTIAEHLGDAYWRVGRRVEARFAWKASLDAGPDAAGRTRVALKLDRGLDAVTAAR